MARTGAVSVRAGSRHPSLSRALTAFAEVDRGSSPARRFLGCARAVPRFAPRDFLAQPSQFGRAAQPVWLPPTDDTLLTKSRRALALLQHNLARGVEAEIRERGITQKQLAEELGVPAGTLGKKLRGHDALFGEDVFAWMLHLGRVELWPAPANLDELLP